MAMLSNPRPDAKTRWALLAGVVAVVLAGYWPILFNSFVDFDDNFYITANKEVMKGLTPETFLWAFKSINVSNWHPVTMLSHLLDVSLFGMAPGGHHGVGLVLAAMNAVLLVLVFERLTGNFYRSLCVGLLFAAHPIHVESIAWASSRKDLLSLFFALLTIHAYVRWVAAPTAGRYALMLTYFALGLMSKPSVITLPAVLLLLDFWPLNRSGAGPEEGFDAGVKAYVKKLPGLVWEKAGLLAISVVFSVVVFLVQRSAGSVAQVENMPIGARVLNTPVAYALYLKKLVWPDDLVFLYPHPVWRPLWVVVLSCVVLVAVTVLVVMIARKTDRRYLPVGWLWFLGAMIPMIGLVQVGAQSMADRYAYFTFIGLYIAMVWGAADLVARFKNARLWVTGAFVTVLAGLVWTTHAQARYWHDSVTLFNRHQAVAGFHAHIENNMGVIYLRKGEPALALGYFERVIKAEPGNAEVYLNYARALVMLKRYDEAETVYRKTVSLDPSQAVAWLRLGLIASGTGRVDEAEKIYAAFAKARPDLAEPFFYLGQIREQKGDAAQAQALYREAIQKNPRFVAGYEALGELLEQKGDHAGAGEMFARAEPIYREAIAVNSADADAYNGLGRALAQKGDIRGAEAMFAKAVELAPGNTLAQTNLARARAILGGK